MLILGFLRATSSLSRSSSRENCFLDTTDGLPLLSDSVKCFSLTVITEGEVISWVSTKFKLALNNWIKTFKWTLDLKWNWCGQCSQWLMLLSSWAAGIFTASPHSSEDEGVAAATFIWEFRRVFRNFKASNWENPKNIEFQVPQNLDSRDENYIEN